MATPQQFLITAESKTLADADVDNPDRVTGEDHSAHAPGRTCLECGRVIEKGQAARRRGEADWAHDVCPRLG
jgi:hypothetical protein